MGQRIHFAHKKKGPDSIGKKSLLKSSQKPYLKRKPVQTADIITFPEYFDRKFLMIPPPPIESGPRKVSVINLILLQPVSRVIF